MPVRATVQPLPEPGRAILRLSDLDAAPEGLSLSIERQQGPDTHLAGDGWRRTEAWLTPAGVKRGRGVLEFELGPEICDRLAGVATVRLRVREPHVGVVGSTVVAWPSMLTSGAASAGPRPADDVVSPRRGAEAPPEEAPPPPVDRPAPKPELRAVREARPERDGSGGWILATLVAILVTAGGAYAYWHFTRELPAPLVASAPPSPAPAAPAETPKKSIREAVAEYMATKPAPAAMVATAKAYMQAGDLQGAFLVWRHAAEAGDAEALLALAAFYDPLATPPHAGFAPDGVRAADWYERAALAGLPEAQRKLGLLLAKGGAGLPADPAKARGWLQQAADQNDAEARKVLTTLPK